MQFIDNEAMESSDESEDIGDSGDEIDPELRNQNKSQFYNEQQLQRRARAFDAGYVDDLVKKYENQEDEDLDDDRYDQDDDGNDIDDYEQKVLLPSVKDPRLWMVRVKKGQERNATMALMNKSIDFA